MKELEKSIKDGKSKSCPLCKNALACSSYTKHNGKYWGRELWCRTCRSKYYYFKYRTKFLIHWAEYKLPAYNVTVQYDHPKRANNWIAKTRILPKLEGLDDAYGPKWNYNAALNLDVELPFPISKDKLEEQISLYITFS